MRKTLPAFFTREEWPWNTNLFRDFEKSMDKFSDFQDLGITFPPANVWSVKPKLTDKTLSDEDKKDGTEVETFEPYYVVELAVAGYTKNGLEVGVDNQDLIVRSKGKPKDMELQDTDLQSVSSLINGIANRKFERRFRFNAPINVEEAKLRNGILRLTVKFSPPTDEVVINIDD